MGLKGLIPPSGVSNLKLVYFACLISYVLHPFGHTMLFYSGLVHLVNRTPRLILTNKKKCRNHLLSYADHTSLSRTGRQAMNPYTEFNIRCQFFSLTNHP